MLVGSHQDFFVSECFFRSIHLSVRSLDLLNYGKWEALRDPWPILEPPDVVPGVALPSPEAGPDEGLFDPPLAERGP